VETLNVHIFLHSYFMFTGCSMAVLVAEVLIVTSRKRRL